MRAYNSNVSFKHRPRLNTATQSPFEGYARSSSSVLYDEDAKGSVKMQWRKNMLRHHRKMTIVDASRKPSNVSLVDSHNHPNENSAKLLKSNTSRFNRKYYNYSG